MTSAVFTDTFLFTDKFLRRFLTGVILSMVAVVVGVAGIAFFTSFEAIKAFAETSGGVSPEHAWMVPLLVDSFLFISSAADLWLTITGSNRHADTFMQNILVWSPKALLAAAAGMSFALNVAHAQPHIGARVVAVLAPIALVLTFEILMMVVRRAAAARVDRLQGQPSSGWTDEAVAKVVRRAVAASKTVEAPEALPPPVPTTPAAAADRAGPPPRPRPAASLVLARGLSKADRQALYRAKKQAAEKGEDVTAALEQVISVRNIDRSLVTQNGSKP